MKPLILFQNRKDQVCLLISTSTLKAQISAAAEAHTVSASVQRTIRRWFTMASLPASSSQLTKTAVVAPLPAPNGAHVLLSLAASQASPASTSTPASTTMLAWLKPSCATAQVKATWPRADWEVRRRRSLAARRMRNQTGAPFARVAPEATTQRASTASQLGKARGETAARVEASATP